MSAHGTHDYTQSSLQPQEEITLLPLECIWGDRLREVNSLLKDNGHLEAQPGSEPGLCLWSPDGHLCPITPLFWPGRSAGRRTGLCKITKVRIGTASCLLSKPSLPCPLLLCPGNHGTVQVLDPSFFSGGWPFPGTMRVYRWREAFRNYVGSPELP